MYFVILFQQVHIVESNPISQPTCFPYGESIENTSLEAIDDVEAIENKSFLNM